METTFAPKLESYSHILRDAKISFREDDKTLSVGLGHFKPGWVLYISCKTTDTISLLKALLYILKETQISFQLIKNQLLQYRLNSGAFGENEVGKVISIFPKDNEQAVGFITKAIPLTKDLKGPLVPNTLRLDNLIYVSQISVSNNGIQFSVPTEKHSPFIIPQLYKAKDKPSTIIGRYYIPVQLLRASPKGNIYKAINLKKLSFSWCLIKQGKPVALDDHFEREMKDRLLWQKEVLIFIADEVYTPRVLDYFEQNDSSYLVLEYAEGIPLFKMVKDIFQDRKWKELISDEKIRLLNWFLKALKIADSIHRLGFVHRDITDSNFLVLEDDNLCIIDFELAYCTNTQRPSPPFVLGTYGYAAPEQLRYAVPDTKEDIYSLGALLCFLVTGTSPINFIEKKPKVTQAKLEKLTGNVQLTKLIGSCLQTHATSRPELCELKEVIETNIGKLK